MGAILDKAYWRATSRDRWKEIERNTTVEELILELIGLGADEVANLSKSSVAKEAATLSTDFLAAIQKVLALHASNAGKTIDQVIAEL